MVKVDPTRSSAAHIQLFTRVAGAPIRWRLLSGNNREVGRGAQEFPDIEACRLEVKELQLNVDDLEARVRRTGPNAWAWQLVREGSVVALSGRTFDRLIRCDLGVAQFLQHLRDAEIGPTTMVSYARRWQF